MLFRDEQTGMYIPLEVLAMKLAPLLAQPAPAEMQQRNEAQQEIESLRRQLAEVETANADLYLTMEQATQRRNDATVKADDLAVQLQKTDQVVFELRCQLDDAHAIMERRERQNTTLMRVIEGMADSRDRMAAELAQVRKDSDAKIEMLDAQLDAVTLRSNEAHRNLAALTAMWNAIPWAAMDDIVSTSGVTGSRWQVARGWLDEYRPTTEANS